MNTRNLVGSLALALALNACSEKDQKAAGPDKAPSGDQAGPKPEAAQIALDGPLVDWRDLVQFVPDKLGEFEQRDEIEGETASIAGMQASRVVRKYVAG